MFHHLGIDDGLEVEVASPTAPNMDLPLVPFFYPFRGNQRVIQWAQRIPKVEICMGTLEVPDTQRRQLTLLDKAKL